MILILSVDVSQRMFFVIAATPGYLLCIFKKADFYCTYCSYFEEMLPHKGVNKIEHGKQKLRCVYTAECNIVF